ncbi:ImuA family protein [Loktanella agnita]
MAARRVHEAEGAGRRAFALFQATRHPGPLIWVLPAHVVSLPMLRGLPDGVGERLHIVYAALDCDLLWSVEEALRSPAAGMVIAEVEQPLSLKAGRRLQLAAEAGQTTGLLLIQHDQGSNAAETRWNCIPVASDSADSTEHAWSTIKNKKGTLASWVVNWNGTSDSFDLVTTVGVRDGAPQAAR